MMIQRDAWKQKAKDLAIMSNGITTAEEREAWDSFKYFRNKINNKKKYDERDFKKKKFEENIDIQKRHGELQSVL